MRAKITVVALGSVLGALAASGSAQAEPGFTVDPQSPAGVEYAVPLDTARGQGGGHYGAHTGGGSGTGSGTTTGRGSASAGGSPALFGSGITPPAKSGSSRGKPRAQDPRPKPRPHAGGGARGPAVAPPVAASASYSSTGPIAAVVGAILLLGGGVGFLLRLRARRTPSS